MSFGTFRHRVRFLWKCKEALGGVMGSYGGIRGHLEDKGALQSLVHLHPCQYIRPTYELCVEKINMKPALQPHFQKVPFLSW